MQDASKSLKKFLTSAPRGGTVSPAFQLSRVPVQHNETLDFANAGRQQMETTGTSPHDRDASYLTVDMTYPFFGDVPG